MEERMFSFRKIISPNYQTVSDRSDSSKSSSNRSASNRSTTTVSRRDPHSNSTLTLESGPTDVKVSKAFLYIEHSNECPEKISFAGKHFATISHSGTRMEFTILQKELEKHANCPFVLKGIVLTKKPLPENCQYMFTVRGEVNDLLPMVGNHAFINLSENMEMAHGDGALT